MSGQLALTAEAEAVPEETAPPPKVTEADVLTWLRRRYDQRHGNGERYVFATHVHDASGFNYRRTADAVAMDLWVCLRLRSVRAEACCTDYAMDAPGALHGQSTPPLTTSARWPLAPTPTVS